MLVARLSSLLSSIGKLVRRRGREGGGGGGTASVVLGWNKHKDKSCEMVEMRKRDNFISPESKNI